MAAIEEHEVFARIGEAGFADICAAFYAEVARDDLLGPMYPADDMVGAETRLREFLIYRFGGPPRYIEQRGHPRLRMRHAPFAIDSAARDRWLTLMRRAVDSANIDTDAAQVLDGFFANMATFLINRQDRDGQQ